MDDLGEEFTIIFVDDFCNAADPLPEGVGQDGQNFISSKWSLHLPSLVRIDARNFKLTW